VEVGNTSRGNGRRKKLVKNRVRVGINKDKQRERKKGKEGSTRERGCHGTVGPVPAGRLGRL
jgi:hypothetical protein